MHFQFQKSKSQVWLLLYDLYNRAFKKRVPAVIENVKKQFNAHNIMDIEKSLWTSRVKLAAAFARVRIKNSALCLSDLLPQHLKNSKIGQENCTPCPVTCWININKVRYVKFVNFIIYHENFQMYLGYG